MDFSYGQCIITDFNKCATVMPDVNNREIFKGMGGMDLTVL